MRRHGYTFLAIAAALLIGGSTLAQQNQQQKPSTTQEKPQMSMDDMMKGCREHCEQTSASIDQLMKSMDEATQSNDPARMRAALDQAQKPLADMKQHMNMCMNMMGMMQKMHGMGGMMGGGQAGMMQRGQSGTAGTPAQKPPAGELDIALTTQPTPPRSGDNTFEVTVKDAAGKPVADADVSINLVMPKMGNMPEMKQSIRLSRVRDGLYRGKGQVPMAGRWETTIVVSRDGKQVGTKSLSIDAR